MGNGTDIADVSSIFGTAAQVPTEAVTSDGTPVSIAAPSDVPAAIAAPVIPAPTPDNYDPNMMLSTSYSLANLTATNQSLSQPNMPSTQQQLSNLSYLADVLEQLSSQIGAFTLLSGFRTKELQDVLTAKGDPTAAGTSFHELGRAEDIAPTTMSPAEFFGRLLANKDLMSKFAEIAIKPSQNALHLAINVPDDNRVPKVLGLNSAGVYARLSPSDILSYISPYVPAADATNYADQLGSSGISPMVWALAAAGLFLLFTRKKAT